MCLSCTVFEIWRVICRNSPLRPNPPAFGAPLGVTPFKFRKDFWYQKTKSPWAIVRRCLLVPLFSHFSRTQTHDRHTTMAYTTQSIACMVKQKNMLLTQKASPNQKASQLGDNKMNDAVLRGVVTKTTMKSCSKTEQSEPTSISR